MNTNQAAKQIDVFDYSNFQKSKFLGSFLHMAMSRGLMKQFESDFSWIGCQSIFLQNMDPIFFDPIIQNQMVNFIVVPECKTLSALLYNYIFSNLNFDQSNFCVFDISYIYEVDQVDFFLAKQCEADFSSLIFGIDLNQNVSQATT